MELAELLLSTLPLCLKFPRTPPLAAAAPSDDVTSLSDVQTSVFPEFKHISKRKRRSTKFPQLTEVCSSAAHAQSPTRDEETPKQPASQESSQSALIARISSIFSLKRQRRHSDGVDAPTPGAALSGGGGALWGRSGRKGKRHLLRDSS